MGITADEEGATVDVGGAGGMGGMGDMVMVYLDRS